MSAAYDYVDPVDAQIVRLRDDFDFFARNTLNIRTKTGAIERLHMNRLQRHLHEKLEAQRRNTGKVRAIVVKGRQGGCSTYLEARYYHRGLGAKNALQIFILTHEQPATENIFGIAQRYHDGMPDGLRPPTKTANAKELAFSDNGVGYQVATAGTKGIGRSATFQLFHGSEVAYWPNAEDHIAGVFQTVGDAPGTEIILESTANGVGNLFHRLAMASVRGANEYELIFIPWFWSEDYERPCPSTWTPSKEWLSYGQIHKLQWEQLYWAFIKNRELAQSINADEDKPCWKFKQEYPSTFDEAFQSSGNSFIEASFVLKARHPETTILGRGPIILGIDPAAQRDKLGIIDRCGRVLGERICERWEPSPDVEYVGARVAAVINRVRPDAVNIDTSEGFGAALYAWLVNHGHERICNAVNFGSSPVGCGPTGDELYANRRAEMWDVFRFWFVTPGGVKIPDDDGLHADITAPQWGPGQTRNSPTTHELIIEPKEKIKERLGASPDLGDAAALTFAVPFAENMMAQNQPMTKRRTRGGY